MHYVYARAKVGKDLFIFLTVVYLVPLEMSRLPGVGTAVDPDRPCDAALALCVAVRCASMHARLSWTEVTNGISKCARREGRVCGPATLFNYAHYYNGAHEEKKKRRGFSMP
ncbi:hypothetical protein CDAR_267671 [Caerostris darwini]|uniref:Secreted protein n=1 Tax=Caerostris darwini TaxID=1538125 RepID=A0AAV4U476_9ARAC|nr:hypothetical protein CDAR_267671 [Caerostris darwini]